MQLARDESLDIRVMRLDVLLDHEVADAVASAEREIGRGLDVLVNNAGIGITGPVEVQDMEATSLAFYTNVPVSYSPLRTHETPQHLVF